MEKLNLPLVLIKERQLEKLHLLTEVLTRLITEEFTGHIKVNFSQGGIGRIEKFEEILKGK
ncbi:MAG: hypothetical protein FD174_1631 [Geobacteraceae bacterium]|nr:MAG: hypothetical protein FD174_1631 [Geobacteraceae bacterium]